MRRMDESLIIKVHAIADAVCGFIRFLSPQLSGSGSSSSRLQLQTQTLTWAALIVLVAVE